MQPPHRENRSSSPESYPFPPSGEKCEALNGYDYAVYDQDGEELAENHDEDEPAGDAHEECGGAHRSVDGYTDCAGQPL